MTPPHDPTLLPHPMTPPHDPTSHKTSIIGATSAWLAGQSPGPAVLVEPLLICMDPESRVALPEGTRVPLRLKCVPCPLSFLFPPRPTFPFQSFFIRLLFFATLSIPLFFFSLPFKVSFFFFFRVRRLVWWYESLAAISGNPGN